MIFGIDKPTKKIATTTKHKEKPKERRRASWIYGGFQVYLTSVFISYFWTRMKFIVRFRRENHNLNSWRSSKLKFLYKFFSSFTKRWMHFTFQKRGGSIRPLPPPPPLPYSHFSKAQQLHRPRKCYKFTQSNYFWYSMNFLNCEPSSRVWFGTVKITLYLLNFNCDIWVLLDTGDQSMNYLKSQPSLYHTSPNIFPILYRLICNLPKSAESTRLIMYTFLN